MEREVESYLRRKYEASIRDIEVVHKEDLDLVRVANQSTPNQTPSPSPTCCSENCINFKLHKLPNPDLAIKHCMTASGTPC